MSGKASKRSARPRRRWVLAYFTPHRSPLAIGVAVMALRAGVVTLAPWPLKFIVDNVIFQRHLPHYLGRWLPDPHAGRVELLAVLCAAIVALGVLDAALDYAGGRIFLDVGQKLVFALRHDLFMRLQRLSLDFHHKHRGGDLMSRLGGDVAKLQDLVTTVGGDFIQNALVVIGAAAIMFWVDWKFGLAILAAFPLIALVMRFYAVLLQRALRDVRRREGDLWSMAQEVFGSMRLVQAYGRESYEGLRFEARAEPLLAAGKRVNELQAQFSPMLTVSVAVALAVITWYGASQVITGAMTAGELLVFLSYFRALSTPVRRVGKTSRVVGRASIALDRIADYLLETPTIADRPGALAPRACKGVLAYEHVGFHYEPGRPVLEDIAFTLTPGRTVALIGPTGGGKSTIAAMAPRLHDPTEGRVTLDGRDLRSLKLAYLRANVAMVLQESMLFQATIWENICYGREGSSRDDAVAAARSVGVHDLIMSLPGDYELLVSERGQTLSGGQRQCVSVARAMLSNAPVVILDEPSSNLDAATERQLMTAISRLIADRSALIIAHRLRTVVAANEILVLDHGRIVQRGRHEELIDAAGLYANLWRIADGAFDADVVRLRTA